jgi:hypothetical protein
MQIVIATSIEKTIKTKTPSPFEKRQKSTQFDIYMVHLLLLLQLSMVVVCLSNPKYYQPLAT